MEPILSYSTCIIHVSTSSTDLRPRLASEFFFFIRHITAKI